MHAVIIIPTYNERNNIGPLVNSLQREFERMPHGMHVLVVDDNSPDGTADVVRLLQSTFKNLHLLTGEKAGLGVAYTRGMRHAMDDLGAEVVFEMDADFSHKPEDIHRLMAEIDAGVDFVIGSRYVPGGSIPKEWGLRRKLNSKFGNMVARHLAGISQVRDCTAGFRAIRVSLLRKIELSSLGVKGYAFQVALLHQALILRARVVEVPVEFIDRTQGESKLGLKDIVEFMLNAWRIRLNSLKTFMKFAIVGASGVAVNLGCFTILLMDGISKYISSPIAIAMSIASNFLLNNYWTFRCRKTRDGIPKKGLKFTVVSIFTLGISYGTFIILSLTFSNTAPQVSQLAGIIPAFLFNYFLNSKWTFRQLEDYT